jgi:hypothetical protein
MQKLNYMSTLICIMCKQEQKRMWDLSFIGRFGYCKQCSLTQKFANNKWNYFIKTRMVKNTKL